MEISASPPEDSYLFLLTTVEFFKKSDITHTQGHTEQLRDHERTELKGWHQMI